MKEKPIIFNGEMVRAILEGRKTQTRLPIKTKIPIQPGWINHFIASSTDKKCEGKYIFQSIDNDFMIEGETCTEPFSKPYLFGQRLWVRETYCEYEDNFGGSDRASSETLYAYRIDGEIISVNSCNIYGSNKYKPQRWTPSIFMPRCASRITLEITNIRVERLQDIKYEEIYKEGIVPMPDKNTGIDYTRGERFINLWNSIYEKDGHGWDKNPWVWAYDFKVVKNA